MSVARAPRPAPRGVSERLAEAVRPLWTRQPHPLHAPRLVARIGRPWLMIGLATLAVALVLALRFDRGVILTARTLPAGVIDAFNWYSDFGRSNWFLIPLGVAFLLLWGAAAFARSRFAAEVISAAMIRIGFLFVAIGLPSLAVTLIKRVIARGRPYLTDAIDPLNFAFPSWDAQFASFPSGHAVTACAAAAAFGALWPRWRPLFWLYALAILASRVIVTAHFPSDVIGGAVFGLGGALLVRNWFANRRLAFGVTAEGAVRPLSSRWLSRLIGLVSAKR